MHNSKRRHRHEITSWWVAAVPPSNTPLKSHVATELVVDKADEARTEWRDNRESIEVHVLKEGENWLTFHDDCQVQCAVQIESNKFNVGNTQDTEDHKAPAVPLPVLCIDVDNITKSTAIKDVRNIQSNDASSKNKEIKLEIFLARRKRIGKTKTDTIKCYKESNVNDIESKKKAHDERMTSESYDMSSSGYTTDDEQDEMEDVREENSPTKAVELDDVIKYPPDESDVDHQGSLLYEPTESLPPRQLRILKDGDRLIMRFTPTNRTNPLQSRIVKFEYTYAIKKKQPINNKHPSISKRAGNAIGEVKPRLLSVKSDVKLDCKVMLTANGTTAKASDDDISIKATKEVNHPDGKGKDWSAFDDAAGNGGNKDKNLNQNKNEDDGMEEYSYLTGEIVMKDQDYISALTGDEGTIPTPKTHDGGKSWRSNEYDVATASPSAARANGTSSPCTKKEVSFDAKFSPKMTSLKTNREMVCALDNHIKGESDVHSEEKCLTGRSQEHDQDDNEYETEEELELLSHPSQPSSEKKNYANAERNDNDDPSLTQPLTFQVTVNNEHANDNSKGYDDDDSTAAPDIPPLPSHVQLGYSGRVQEENGHDDDDSTTAPDIPLLPSQVELGHPDCVKEEKVECFSPLTTNSPSHRPEEQSNNEDDKYNACTQFVAFPVSVKTGSSQSKEDNYIVETQFQCPVDILKDVHEDELESKDGNNHVHSSKSIDDTDKPSHAMNVKTDDIEARTFENHESVNQKSHTKPRSPEHSDRVPSPRYGSNELLSGDAVRNGAMIIDSVVETEHNVKAKDFIVANGSGKEFARNDGPEAAKNVEEPSVTHGRNIRSTHEASSITLHERPKRHRRRVTTPARDNQGTIRIMFTGIDVTPKHKKACLIKSIGAELVESMEEACSVTHVIATDGKSKLRRTPKLMICICNTSNILSAEWLEQSASQHKVLDPEDFLVLGDTAAETAYNFSMKETLRNGKDARQNGGVLADYSVYICKGVADNNAPPMKVLQLIIEAAGGQVIKSLSNTIDLSKTIVLTSDPSTAAQLAEKGVEKIGKLGSILSTSWLFHTMITQKFSRHLRSNSLSEIKKPRSKRKAETLSDPPTRCKQRSSRSR